MNKHTPGDWYIADEDELANAQTGDDPFGIWSDQDGKDIRICGVNTKDTPERIRGNAHLLVSAPEMLEMLELAVACCDLNTGIGARFPKNYPQQPNGDPDFEAISKLVHAVIAKARGEK